MAKVDLKALEAKAEKDQKESLLTQIQEKVVAGVKVFKGPSLEDWFDDYGECILANSEAKRQAEYKKSGLDEFGRTKEVVAMSSKKAELLAKKASLFADIKKLDLQIQQLKVEDFVDAPKKAKK
jgi:hypothetical protein